MDSRAADPKEVLHKMPGYTLSIASVFAKKCRRKTRAGMYAIMKSAFRVALNFMSKYSKTPLDFSGLRTVGLKERGGKVKIADFASPYRKGSGLGAWLSSLPRILAGSSLRGLLDAIAGARSGGRAIVWGLGGHVIKCGLAPVLIDLMRRGYVTAFALNGSAAIHDFEIALAGHTSEDVEAVLPDGRFGTAEETGREMNRAICAGDQSG